MSKENWKLEKDLCRCCHSEGRFKSLAEPCIISGQVEVYSDMLRDCFDIDMAPALGALCSMTYKICEACIIHLRDAMHFKKQILKCEEVFRDMYSRIINVPNKPASSVDVKQEIQDTGQNELLIKTELEYNEDTEMINDNDDPVNETNDPSIKADDISVDEWNILKDGSPNVVDSDYESGAPGTSTEKKLRTEIVHEHCVTTYSRQDFKPSETQSTDDTSRRLNKGPKTSAERGREFRARKALLKQQSKQQQDSDGIEITTEDIRNAEIRIIEKRAKSADATRRWRERRKGVSDLLKKQAKTAAQRMREYRGRKKMKGKKTGIKVRERRETEDELYQT